MARHHPRKTFLPVALLLALMLVLSASAQLEHDPLTRGEGDQIRDASGNLPRRIDLLLQFAQDRLDHFDRERQANNFDRSTQMHQALRDYSDILGELDDNIDELMAGHVTSETQGKLKPEKPLRAVVDKESAMLAALKRIEATSSPADLAIYRYTLDDCLDDTHDSLKGAQQDLVEVQRRKEQEKLDKKRLKQQEKDEQKALHE